MAVQILPEFIVDLQVHADPNFAKRVLQKTISRDGTFKADDDDHRYHGVDDAWIRYISRGNTAYRVIFIRKGADVYLYRAGEHSIEDNLTGPKEAAFNSALPVQLEGPVRATEDTAVPLRADKTAPPPNRLLRNNPHPEINRAIFSRRNFPHKDIWLVSPYISIELLQPTAQLGKLLFDQVEDGASVTLITTPPKDQNIEWLERLDERKVGIYFYPKLHSKLYCFVLDENRVYERGMPDRSRMSSLLLLGSSNLTGAGLALNGARWNEELCYAVPEDELDYVERYVTELMMRGYDLRDVRSLRARGQWQKLENDKW